MALVLLQGPDWPIFLLQSPEAIQICHQGKQIAMSQSGTDLLHAPAEEPSPHVSCNALPCALGMRSHNRCDINLCSAEITGPVTLLYADPV